jgi:uncharacterized protein (DUF2141 family)
MKTIFIIFSALMILVSSCRKEGLSKKTGNLEISVGGKNTGLATLFTESEFNNFKNAKPYLIFKESSGSSITENKTTFTFNGVPSGVYAMRIYWSSFYGNNPPTNVEEKTIIIEAKKINKISF